MKRLLPILLAFLVLFLFSCEGQIPQNGGSETPDSSSTSESSSTGSGGSSTSGPSILNMSSPVLLAPAGMFGKAYKIDKDHIVYGAWENSESSSTLYLEVFSVPDGTVVKKYKVYSIPKEEGDLSSLVREVGGTDENHVWVVYSSADGDPYSSTNFIYYSASSEKLNLTNECGVKGYVVSLGDRNYGDLLYVADQKESGKTCVITFGDDSVSVKKADTGGAFMHLVKVGDDPLDFIALTNSGKLVRVENGVVESSATINGLFGNMEMGEDGYVYAPKGEVTAEFVVKIDPYALSMASKSVYEGDASIGTDYVVPYSGKILVLFSKLENLMESTYKTWYAVLDNDLNVIKEATEVPYTMDYDMIASVAPAGYGIDSDGRLWTLAKSQDDQGYSPVHDNSVVVVFDENGNIAARSLYGLSGEKLFFGVFDDKGVMIYKASYDENYYLVEYSM